MSLVQRLRTNKNNIMNRTERIDWKKQIRINKIGGIG